MVPVFSISPVVFFLLLLLVLRSFYETQFNAELLAQGCSSTCAVECRRDPCLPPLITSLVGAIAVTVPVAWDGMWANVPAQLLQFEFGTSMLNTPY